MHIIINPSSMIPIYEQISAAVKREILSGSLTADAALPSVRALAKELRISALTVKKAYDQLEAEGFTETVHGKGTYVREVHPALAREEQLRQLETELQTIAEKARRCGITPEELRALLDLILED